MKNLECWISINNLTISVITLNVDGFRGERFIPSEEKPEYYVDGLRVPTYMVKKLDQIKKKKNTQLSAASKTHFEPKRSDAEKDGKRHVYKY